jgi:hypothetical protein
LAKAALKDIEVVDVSEEIVGDSVYSKIAEELAAEFPPEDLLVLPAKGGLTYITGEAVISRLNTVLGIGNWDFRVLERGEADKDQWVLGQLTVRLPGGVTVVKEQFGQTTMSSGMTAGDSIKGAATDALKKCASYVNVGLWLSKKVAKQAPAQAQRNSGTTTPTPSAADVKASLMASYRKGIAMAGEHDIDISKYPVSEGDSTDTISKTLFALAEELKKFVVLDKKDQLWLEYEDVRAEAVSLGVSVPDRDGFVVPMERKIVQTAVDSLKQVIAEKKE